MYIHTLRAILTLLGAFLIGQFYYFEESRLSITSIIINITIIILVCILAYKMGRSWKKWGIFAFIFPHFTSIILAFMPSLRMHREMSRANIGLFNASKSGIVDEAKNALERRFFGLLRGANINYIKSNGTTPLLSAIANRNTNLATFLLEQGANPNLKSPLIEALNNDEEAIATLLIDKGANVNTMNNKGEASLLLASNKGYKEIVENLIDKGANIDARDKDGNTPLIQAAKAGGKETAELLIDKGADVNTKNKNGDTPLIFTSNRGYIRIVELLVNRSANVNTKSNNGCTALILSANKGHKEITELLIAKGADVNAQNIDGETSLLLASRNGYQEIVELLIAKGADVNTKDKDGNTPLSLAYSGGYGELAEQLKHKGAKEPEFELDQKLASLDWGFSFNHHKGWEITWKDEPAGSWIIPYAITWKLGDNSKVVFMINAHNIELLKGDDNLTFFNVNADGTVGQSPKTPSEYLDMTRQSIPSDFDKYKYISSKVTRIDNIPAASISYNYEQSGTEVYEKMITVFSEGKTLQLICTMPDSKRHEGMKLCRDILDTFQIAKSLDTELEPVFTWSNDRFAGNDKKWADLVNTENQRAIAWDEAQDLPAIPRYAGESGAANYCFKMASMAERSGNLKGAWAGFHQALRRYATLDDNNQFALTCFNLGKVYGAQKNWKMAQIMFKQSAYLAKEVGTRNGLAWSLAYLGDTYDKLDQKASCYLYLKQALEIMPEVSPQDADAIGQRVAELAKEKEVAALITSA